MRLVQPSSYIEYRDANGQDHDCRAEVWRSADQTRAVIVLRDVPATPRLSPVDHGKLALARLQEIWLPFIAPHARVSVLMIQACDLLLGTGKVRARSLPAA